METTKIFVLSIICIASLLFSGCSDDDGYELDSRVPIVVDMILVDENGNNLLTESNIDVARKCVYLTDDGVDYRVDTVIYNPKQTFRSFQLPNGCYRLSFGVGACDCEDKTYIINYGDGNSDELKITVKDFFAEGVLPTCQVKINGEAQPAIKGSRLKLSLTPNCTWLK